MIVVRTPLRVSFLGGGTDLPAFFQQEQGACFSAAITQYVWAIVNKKFDKRIRVSYSKTENVAQPWQIQNELIRESLVDRADTSEGMEIVTVADVPSTGTGLGSSSSLAVALAHALCCNGETMDGVSTKHFIARRACHVEMERCAKPIGKQDQYAAAFGGVNLIKFFPDGEVDVVPISNGKMLERLQNHLLLLYVGQRDVGGDEILRDWNANIGSVTMPLYRKMAKMAEDAYLGIEEGHLASFSAYMKDAWEIKKSLSKNISTPNIDALYEKGIQCGALAGKLLGAGGGGFGCRPGARIGPVSGRRRRGTAA